MKKVILFYLLCCFSITLLCLVYGLDFDNVNFKFMFQLTLFATCAIYAPIITISASILYHTNINKAILSNKWYSIIYCILLFLCCAFLDIFCKKAVIHISYYRLWNSIPIVFIIQNVVIIIKRNISNLSQNNS